MGAQFIKHKNWDDLAFSDWKHLFSMQSNFKKFEEIWRFILLIRSLFRRLAERQNLNAVVWAWWEMRKRSIERTNRDKNNILLLLKCFNLDQCANLVQSVKQRHADEQPLKIKAY